MTNSGIRKKLNLNYFNNFERKKLNHFYKPPKKQKRIKMSEKRKQSLDLFKGFKIPPIPEQGRCKFIYGTNIKEGKHKWCNEKVGNSKSYCKKHEMVCFGKVIENGKGKTPEALRG